MPKRLLCAAGACLILTSAPAAAQQTLNLSIGYFAPHGADARARGDVLTANQSFLTFDVKDFGSAAVGGEWLVPIGQFLEGGVGVGFSRRTVHTVYSDFVDSDGTEIEQDLRLRIVPIAFTFRVTPLGQSSPVQPYLGAGLGIFSWRYSETGEFVDFSAQRAIFRDAFVASGSEPGSIVLGGIRFVGERVSTGFEIRYQRARADLASGFAGDILDLGGWTYQLTVGARF
jgi:hypothetical protein